MIEDALRSLLTSITALTDIVEERIRPDELAEGDDFPAVIFEIEDEDPLEMLDQVGGLQKGKVLITALADTKRKARQIAKIIRENIDGEANTVAGLEIRTYFVKRKNAFVPIEEGSDVGVYESESEFEVWWDDTTA